MKWFEFTEGNGDGSYSKLRFRTREEAQEARDWLEQNDKYFEPDGDGVSEVDTDRSFFFRTLEQLKTERSR